MYQVGAYDFESMEEAQAARKELDGIQYIRAQTRMDDPQTVLRLYDKLILKDVFSTPVGYHFLYELQEYLKACPQIRQEQVHRIPVRSSGTEDDSMSAKKEAIRQGRRLEEVRKELAEAKRLNRNKMDYKKSFRNCLIFSVVCVAVIIGMFVINAVSANNINIINYENKILDKYESWEQELGKREAEIRAREAQLGIETPQEEEDEDEVVQ